MKTNIFRFTLEPGINVAPVVNLAKRISVAPFIPYSSTT